MIGVLKSLFGSPKSTGKIVDAAVKGLDAVVFTEEERSEASGHMRDWYLKYLEATQPQNLSRRFLAIMIGLVWAFILLLASLTYPFMPEYSEFLFKVLVENINTPFGVILGFYFLTAAVRAYKK
jgi:hypothetical protein